MAFDPNGNGSESIEFYIKNSLKQFVFTPKLLFDSNFFFNKVLTVSIKKNYTPFVPLPHSKYKQKKIGFSQMVNEW